MIATASSLAALHVAIVARMTAIAATLPLLGTKAPEPAVDTGVPQERAAAIYEYDPPPKSAENKDSPRYPFLCINPKRGRDSLPGTEEQSTATVEITVGTYSDTNDGGTDVLLIIEAIRRDLGSRPKLEGTAFSHLGPLDWDTPNLGATRPQWLGVVTTVWTLPRPPLVDVAREMGV